MTAQRDALSVEAVNPRAADGEPFRISFEVLGNIVPKQRPQVGSHGAYYPERSPRSKRLSYPDYKALVQAVVLSKLRMNQTGEWPPHNPQLYEALWGLKVTAWVGAGDGDNIAGSFADALQGILWENDSQIRHWEIDVVRTKPKEYRGAAVEAWVLEPQQPGAKEDKP